jgi:hypothetical protein
LLSKTILLQVRQMPDHLRTGKALFKKVVNSLSPEIGYATSPSSASQNEILKQEQAVNLLKNELSSDTAKKLFSAEFLDFVLQNIKTNGKRESVNASSFSLKSFQGKIMPRFIKETLRSKIVLPSIDHYLLAFRVLLIIKMNKILHQDCK